MRKPINFAWRGTGFAFCGFLVNIEIDDDVALCFALRLDVRFARYRGELQAVKLTPRRLRRLRFSVLPLRDVFRHTDA